MATELVTSKLAAVRISPTTLQYQKLKRPNPYIPKFSLSKENWERTLAQPWLKQTDPLMPPYPYGANVNYPEANYGLYGGATIQSGNKISKGRNKGKTLRKWFPNVRVEKIRSESLNKELVIPIRARVMRTIRKSGGLDEYVLGDKPGRIKELGLLGWKLRYLVMKSPAMQERFKAQREELGLPEADPLAETFASAWNNGKKREQLIAQQDQAWKNLGEKLARWDGHVESQWRETRGRAFRGTIRDVLPSQVKLPDRIQETS